LRVRQATIDDLDQYVKLMAEFHNASPMKNVAVFNEQKCRDFVSNSLENSDMLFLLGESEKGILGIASCLLYPLYFADYKVAQELWWWLTPDARGSGIGQEMFKKIENWAKEKNAQSLFMIALEDERAGKMEKVYCRAGFRPLERTFIKEFA
jgi:GNAT superfamily N-acetyltransferase